MVESSPSCQRRPPCKASKEMSDEDADAAALTYLLTPMTRNTVLPGSQRRARTALRPSQLVLGAKECSQRVQGEVSSLPVSISSFPRVFSNPLITDTFICLVL